MFYWLIVFLINDKQVYRINLQSLQQVINIGYSSLSFFSSLNTKRNPVALPITAILTSV